MDTQIRFYHLTRRTIATVLPILLTKILDQNRRAVLRTRDVARWDRYLWTYEADSFLPHGTAQDDHAPDQPIWITDGTDNPNGADVLFILPDALSQEYATFVLVCFIFEDHDVASARLHWKTLQSTPATLTYWQETPTGEWEKKAE